MGLFATVFVSNALLFFAGGTALHLWFYRGARAAAGTWKHQPRKFQSLREIVNKLPLVGLNLTIISGAIAACVWCIVHGKTRAYWDAGSVTWIELGAGTLGLFLWYHGLLYYWHRNMHRPSLFRRFHRIHHHSKAPMFLDALYEHPLEACWGAVVLLSPPFVFPVWAWSYFAFAAIVGLHEIVDHAGVRLNLPFLAPSADHDEHHRRSNVYYGQLLSLLDRLHGTVR